MPDSDGEAKEAQAAGTEARHPKHGVRLQPSGAINPQVLAERRVIVEKRAGDEASTRILRQRYADVIANFLESSTHVD